MIILIGLVLATLEGFFTGHKKSVTSIAFHPTSDPIILATGSYDTTVKLWEIINNKETSTWSTKCITTLKGHSREVTTIAFHPTQPIIISGSLDNTVKVWQLCANNQTVTCVLTIDNQSQVYSVNFHPTSHFPIIAVGCGKKNKESKVETASIKLWRLFPYYKTGTLLGSLKGHMDHVYSVVFNPTNPNIMASGSGDSTAKLWELDFSSWEKSKCIATFGEMTDYTPNTVGTRMKEHNGTIYSVTFHPTMNLLAIGSSSKNGCIRWWSFNEIDGVYVTTCEKSMINYKQNIYAVAYNNKGDVLAAACFDGNVRFYT